MFAKTHSGEVGKCVVCPQQREETDEYAGRISHCAGWENHAAQQRKGQSDIDRACQSVCQSAKVKLVVPVQAGNTNECRQWNQPEEDVCAHASLFIQERGHKEEHSRQRSRPFFRMNAVVLDDMVKFEQCPCCQCCENSGKRIWMPKNRPDDKCDKNSARQGSLNDITQCG